MTDFLNRLPTWLKVALWIALSAAVDALYLAVGTGELAVDPAHLPFINLALVALRDLLRALRSKG